MQHLEGSGTPVLYIGRTVLKGYIIKYAATLPNYPRRCILNDFFNKSNFSKIE